MPPWPWPVNSACRYSRAVGGPVSPGQSCNVAVVLDTSKYMNAILEIDSSRRFARVLPGVILDDLRGRAEPFGLTFEPDPATHTHCTLGGMIGNNSCGIHLVMAGRTSDNIEELEVRGGPSRARNRPAESDRSDHPTIRRRPSRRLIRQRTCMVISSMKVLVATDGSPHSQAAIDSVMGRPWPEGTLMRVVTAVRYPYPLASAQASMPELSLVAFDEQSKTQARSVADAAATLLRERGFAVDAVVREGDARVEIVLEASEWNADLIVVGSHGHTGLRKILLGSVAQYVVSHAPCSVEVARRREENTGG